MPGEEVSKPMQYKCQAPKQVYICHAWGAAEVLKGQNELREGDVEDTSEVGETVCLYCIGQGASKLDRWAISASLHK